MKNRRMALSILAALSISSLLSATPHGETETNIAKTASFSPVYSASETAKFKKLTKETINALTAGDQAKMVAKLTDLETAWDDKEEALRPKDDVTWTALDKILDKGISALRSSRTDRQKGKAALEDLLTNLEKATKPEEKKL